MTVVLLDTNFLLVPEKFHIDIFEEIKRIIPNAKLATVEPVVGELQKLKKKLALGFVKKIEIIKKKGNADKALLETAIEKKAVLCTNDNALKRKSLSAGVPVIYLRKKKILEIVGWVNV
jgi:rRNA-processing protein FCF1